MAVCLVNFNAVVGYRAARDINRRDVGRRERAEARVGSLAGHRLSAIRSGVDVAVSAGLIAELAQVDLKDADAGGAQRGQPVYHPCAQA